MWAQCVTWRGIPKEGSSFLLVRTKPQECIFGQKVNPDSSR
ncbi:hypothetical protein OESDEN_25038 [Oesophagostomum dentatum]|uniref:Uncharacterized protein n=1 Tax=Oesophagostomum dentatum TaxID=61180 RepID=A0A0B1RUM9_OESDE|nr:hypothetical protein OESDEN_25038 [Oesophagostomum dentatum]